ncbi:MAG: DUF2318 domain-containing protein [Synergistaceae bacterium]|nr:DUF2318 domain-containing protein [Synergistaceae bacterium]
MKNIMKKLCQGKLIIAALFAILAAFSASSAKAEILPDGGLFIPIAEVTEKAVFYPLKVDGIDMEVFAVKAPDGTIRTAFNTCQVCYDSGAGYYVQEGDVFVCQNCGNRFKTKNIEIVKGGCNPVPILPEHKTVDEKGITIPKALLSEAKVIFRNWKY